MIQCNSLIVKTTETVAEVKKKNKQTKKKNKYAKIDTGNMSCIFWNVNMRKKAK